MSVINKPRTPRRLSNRSRRAGSSGVTVNPSRASGSESAGAGGALVSPATGRGARVIVSVSCLPSPAAESKRQTWRSTFSPGDRWLISDTSSMSVTTARRLFPAAAAARPSASRSRRR